MLNFIDNEDFAYQRWLDEVKNVWPKVEVLPAVDVRLRDTSLGHPSMLFHKSGQWHPASASYLRSCIRFAPSEAPVEYRAPVALEKPSEAELAMCRQFWEEKREFYKQLQALPPAELAKLFDQHLAPLAVPPKLQPENSQSHDWSI